MIRSLAAAIALCASPVAVFAQAGIWVETGFWSGNEYQGRGAASREAYVSGVVDGLFASVLIDANSSQTTWLKQCLRGVDSKQLLAIADGYMSRHPERWDSGAHVLVYAALVQACDRRGYKKPPGEDR
jgi:hypothetical protein